MALVAAKCTKCGANLEVDSTQEAAVCPHCKTRFITEKAINNYNTYNQNNYQIENAEVHIHDEKSVETRLKNAEVFWTKHQNAEKAREIFQSVTDDAPDDYRGWWGLARISSKEFSYFGCGTELFQTIQEQVNYAFRVAPSDVLKELKEVWGKYVQDVEEYKTKKQKERTNIAAYQGRTEKRVQEIEQQYEVASQKKNVMKVQLEADKKAFEKGSIIVKLAIFGLGNVIVVALSAYIFDLSEMLSGSLPFFLLSAVEWGILGGIIYVIRRFIRKIKKKKIEKQEQEYAQLEALCQNLIGEKARLTEEITRAQNEIQVIDKVLA